MAEALLRSMLANDPAGNVEIGSAGTGASDGIPATALTPRLVREADLILAMESHHADWALGLAPEMRDRIHVITARGAEEGAPTAGVSDPIGGTAEDYEDTFHRIRSHLLRWLPHIRDAIERQEGVR
jgi:protein-tyrosine-phosphatase